MRLRTVICAVFAATVAMAAPISAQERGGSLKVALFPEPPTVVAGLSGLGSASIVSSKIYEALVTYDTDLNPLPWLATSWETSEDGLVWTFNLAEDAKWHDGTPFTAADVVTSYQVFSVENDRLKLISAKIDGVEAVTEHQVRFILKESIPSFIYMMNYGNLPIIPAHLYAAGNFRENPANATPIGTGAFKVADWEKGSYIHLVRFEDYRDGSRPYLDDLYFVTIPDAQGVAVAFEEGSVDVASASNLEGFDVARLSAMDGVERTNHGWEMLAPHGFMWVNTQKAPLDRVELRQALNYALDKDFIRDVVFNGLATPPRGAFDSRTKFFDAGVNAYAFDPEKARDLVAASGYDGAVLKLSTAPVGSAWARLAEYEVQAWKEVGINVELDNNDVGGYLKKLAERSYDLGNIYLYQYGDPSVGVTRNFYSFNDVPGSPWNNVGRYVNPELDALLTQADAVNDPAERAALYAKAQQIIADDAVQVWTAELQFPTLYRSRVRNLVTTALGLSDSFANVWVEQ
ncbi:ABC transporter substrate-binding protein [Antarcticimicrobium luteum]|uniref:ABC transporter substrate-binding protein n=1 Tax=Antarcticimicrobium luteum TaxID=2547397 RepID=A0A4R5V997_9RHOB|nr:ABC transporter substrate-binding protein [Antarcticimicrobium luteum]TDK48682.1 ABC transporter substrate-binding protein [Antarcticimicrobium luteum]